MPTAPTAANAKHRMIEIRKQRPALPYGCTIALPGHSAHRFSRGGNYFVDNRLKLPKGKRSEFLGQVDRLIAKFSAAAADDKVIDIRKFLKTGSFRKGTVLRP